MLGESRKKRDFLKKNYDMSFVPSRHNSVAFEGGRLLNCFKPPFNSETEAGKMRSDVHLFIHSFLSVGHSGQTGVSRAMPLLGP